LTFNGTLSDVTTEDQDELKTMGTLAVRGDVPIMSCRHHQCLWLVPAKPLAAVGGRFGASASHFQLLEQARSCVVCVT